MLKNNLVSVLFFLKIFQLCTLNRLTPKVLVCVCPGSAVDTSCSSYFWELHQSCHSVWTFGGKKKNVSNFAFWKPLDQVTLTHSPHLNLLNSALTFPTFPANWSKKNELKPTRRPSAEHSLFALLTAKELMVLGHLLCSEGFTFSVLPF